MDTRSLLTFLNSRVKLFLALLIVLDAILLVYYTQFLSISLTEANIFFDSKGYLADTIRLSTMVFGQNDFGLRAPFIALHLINLVMIFLVTNDYAKKPVDSLLAVLIFALLPGANAMAFVVSKAGFATLAILLFVYLHNRSKIAAFLLLTIAIFFDNSMFLLSFAYLIFAIYSRDKISIVFGIFVSSLALVLYGFDFGGRPRGYFLDIFGIYGAIFSPLMLVVFVYTIYFFLIQNQDRLKLLWFVSAVPFILSILLSIRQNLAMDEFGSYAVVSAPLMAIAFMNSYRIKLKEFRAAQSFMFRIVFISMTILLFFVYHNKPIYAFVNDPRKHFAYDYHFIKELSDELKNRGIYKISSDQLLAKRLKFYGIENGGELTISRNIPSKFIEKIEFVEANRVVSSFYIY